ncbi:cobalt-precorrin 5A hydrolase [Neptuniibacter caesariensis]|uniref:Cobalamin biosynthesis protein CbiG n=1 Tax=Neptuniibacter caesariensis TaxID=207954 RepID=A0A7U8C6A6_NEPCE|nr:cobalamin biosynthesis protein [Neptuniibacter caesariensis]EAR62318.1 cobalamin biosynthesis protein CbiG [Oceanospirillum sp. MED92] [Neptuniibacter caesariensis]
MIRIITLTEAGKNLGVRLASKLDADLVYKPQPFAEQVQGFFKNGDRLIFICATGIVMRTLAPVLQDKYQDPPVLVIDEQGKFVIPLLSGHEGGANNWALEVSRLLDAQPVITTANGYLNPIYSVGMGCERGCPIDELEKLLMDCLQQAGLTLDQVSSISSIDIKADEVGLIQLAKKLNKPYQTWDRHQLAEMEPLLSTRSDYVFKTVGVYGVAESAALYSAKQHTGQQPELVLNKLKTTKATCAIARSYSGVRDASSIEN